MNSILKLARAGGFHLLRYYGLAIAHYGFALKCLAYESLQLVHISGVSISCFEQRVTAAYLKELDAT